jgi:hypothetical protein
MKGNDTFVLVIFVAQPQCEFVEDYHKTSGYNIVVKIAIDCNKMFIDMFVGLLIKVLINLGPCISLLFTRTHNIVACLSGACSHGFPPSLVGDKAHPFLNGFQHK